MTVGRFKPKAGVEARLAPYNRQKAEDYSREGKVVVWVRIDLGNGKEWLPVGTMK